jgi:hypothetical protein
MPDVHPAVQSVLQALDHASEKNNAWAASGLRPDRVRAPRGLNGVDALRQRLEAANRRVAESRRLVAGWRDIIERERAAGHEARDLLETFQTLWR